MDRLQTLFQSFCNFGAGQRGAFQMNNASFAKFCKDTKVIDKKYTTTDADLLFSKIKPKGGRTISFDCFRYQGLPEIAVKKGLTTNDLVTKMLEHQGPVSSGTTAEQVRFHDDKAQYTGVYKNGGPTNTDLATADLSHITNRGDADVRGSNKAVEKKIPQREKPAYQASKPAPLDDKQVAPEGPQTSSSPSPTAAAAATAAPASAPAQAAPATATAPKPASTSSAPAPTPAQGAPAPAPAQAPPATSTPAARPSPTASATPTSTKSDRPTSQQMARAQMVIGGTGLGGSSTNAAPAPAAGSDPDSPARIAKYGRRSNDQVSQPPSPSRPGARSNSGQRNSRSGSIGFKSGASAGGASTGASPRGSVTSQSGASPSAGSAASAPVVKEEEVRGLHGVFEQYLAFGGGQHGKSEMDNARFAKFCKDSKLLDRHFTSTDADLLFSKIKPKRGRTISFDIWKNYALTEIARKKNMPYEELIRKLTSGSSAVPKANATEADSVRFHDDKSQYTGVHKKGGPTNNDLSTSDLRYITNRAPADVRGVQS